MAAPWYDPAAEPRPEAAWELYHVNAKRSRGGRRPSSGTRRISIRTASCRLRRG